jgi:hypothetical protein
MARGGLTLQNPGAGLRMPPIARNAGGTAAMLDLFSDESSDSRGLGRRAFLRVGGLSALGLSLSDFLRLRASAPKKESTEPKAGACILLWMQGGPSHHDTFDPKPDAPAEVRGEFGTVATTLQGIRICEHLPLLAHTTDKLSIIRGHDPRNGSHGVADHLMMSGQLFNPSLPFPCYGSVLSRERGWRDGMLPFVQLGRHIDRRFHAGIAGILGDQYNPFEVPDDPNAGGFQVRDLSVGDAARQARLRRRAAMLAEVDRYQKAVETAPQAVQARDVFYEKAHSLLTSPAAKRAFDVAAESDSVRDRYGRTTFGQSCLLARRLVEAGVRFVTVTDDGWDTHANNFRDLKKKLPVLDRAYSALLEELAGRGMLDGTLVVWFGDFGRTPRVNNQAGRDHWASAGVACMGGGGVRRGEVVGATTALGEAVVDHAVTPQDLAATIYHCLGIDLHTWYRTQDGRPVELVPEGKPVGQLVG